MKIEKISDNQIKFILSQNDLKSRDLHINELAYGSEKTQDLFRDMMEQAMVECGFYTEQNTPLIIEAVPVATDSIMIIVTKVRHEDGDSKSGIIHDPKDERKYKKIPAFEKSKAPFPKIPKRGDENFSVFSFKTLEDAADAASRIFPAFSGGELFKQKDTYFLVISKSELEAAKKPVSNILLEYGQKHDSPVHFRFYLLEYGEFIIRKDALKTLSSL